MSNPGARVTLLMFGLLLCLAAVFQAGGFAESTGTGGESGSSAMVATRSTVTFDQVDDSLPVGQQGPVLFGESWYGAVDSAVADCVPGEVGPISNTVAVLRIPPTKPAEARISLATPVEAIEFDFALDPALEGPTAVFYDASGFVIGRLLLDVSDRAVGNDYGLVEPADDPRRSGRVEFVDPTGFGIARVEFEGADAVVGHFALDNFTVFDLELIFADGFETGTTERWDSTVGPTVTPTPHDPTCDDIIVGKIAWDGDDGIQISPVANTHPTAQLMHKQTSLDWSYYSPAGPTLRWASLAGVSVLPYGHYCPPIGRNIDIPFSPGASGSFSADWHVNDDGFYPGTIEIRFRFEYIGGGPTCEYIRTIDGLYTPTNTPTITPTSTYTPSNIPALTVTPTPRSR